MSKLTKISAERNNIWSFITLLTELATATVITLIAYNQQNFSYKIFLAVIGSVLIVNLLAKLYVLVQK